MARFAEQNPAEEISAHRIVKAVRDSINQTRQAAPQCFDQDHRTAKENERTVHGLELQATVFAFRQDPNPGNQKKDSCDIKIVAENKDTKLHGHKHSESKNHGQDPMTRTAVNQSSAKKKD